MSDKMETEAGVRLLRAGRSDEDVERLTGMTLLRILELRGAAAAAPAMQISKPHEINFVKNGAASLAILAPVD